MSRLGLIGHQFRGEEIIEILESLGGINKYNLKGMFVQCHYTIDSSNIIIREITDFTKDLELFTLENFIEKYPYKVGDKVIVCGEPHVVTQRWWNDKSNEMLYCTSYGNHWVLNVWEMKKCEVIKTEESTPKTYEEVKEFLLCNPVRNAMNLLDIEKCLNNDGYELPDDVKVNSGGISSIHFIKWYENTGYPKTYDECCDIIGIEKKDMNFTLNTPCSYNSNMTAFIKLLICRDAYWKMKGNWKPDWLDDSTKYVISNFEGNVYKNTSTCCNMVLAFPTKEMMDVFYDCFKGDIELCKDFL